MAIFGTNLRFSQRRSAATAVASGQPRSHILLLGLLAAATAIGLWSLRYLLPSQPYAVHFENFLNRHTAFTLHAAFASIALLVGPWQFLPVVLFGRCWIHRLLGRAAITLRLYIAASEILAIPLGQSYPYIAWLCWIPNTLVAELLIRVTAAPRCLSVVGDRGLASADSTRSAF